VSQARLRCLIVDDERLARAELRRLLGAFADIEIVGEAANALDAVRAVETLAPDLLLLDVQMPGGSGFDVLGVLERAPAVIFTTAFERHALRAFDVNALDYLLKPIEPARLALALQRVRREAPAPAAAAAGAGDGKLFIRDGERCWFVALADIALFESEGNYTRVYFSDPGGPQRPLMRRSLNQLALRLDNGRFFRASRRHIVNLDRVRGVAAQDNGALLLTLLDGQAVEVSRRRAAQLRATGRWA
jgi:two-component system LytT family response regulator